MPQVGAGYGTGEPSDFDIAVDSQHAASRPWVASVRTKGAFEGVWSMTCFVNTCIGNVGCAHPVQLFARLICFEPMVKLGPPT